MQQYKDKELYFTQPAKALLSSDKIIMILIKEGRRRGGGKPHTFNNSDNFMRKHCIYIRARARAHTERYPTFTHSLIHSLTQSQFQQLVD